MILVFYTDFKNPSIVHFIHPRVTEWVFSSIKCIFGEEKEQQKNEAKNIMNIKRQAAGSLL